MLAGVVTGGTGDQGRRRRPDDLRQDRHHRRHDRRLVHRRRPPSSSPPRCGSATGASRVPGAGFGGDSSAPVFAAFMSQALDGSARRAAARPRARCAPGPAATVNPDGGRDDARPSAPVARARRSCPTVQQLPTTPAPTHARADRAAGDRAARHRARRPPPPPERRPVSEELERAARAPGARQRARPAPAPSPHAARTRGAARAPRPTPPRSTAGSHDHAAERDDVAREEQQLDDEARSLAREGERGRGQDVLG